MGEGGRGGRRGGRGWGGRRGRVAGGAEEERGRERRRIIEHYSKDHESGRGGTSIIELLNAVKYLLSCSLEPTSWTAGKGVKSV